MTTGIDVMEGKSCDSEQVLEQVRQICREVIEPEVEQVCAEGRYHESGIRALAQAGIFGVTIASQYGGLGLGSVESSRIIEEVSRVCPSTATMLSVHTSLTSYLIEQWAREDIRHKYLPRLATGEWIGAYSLTEPRSGSDAAGLGCRAERVEGGWRIEGTKNFVTSGDVADVLILFARTSESPSKPSRGISAFLVETGWEGFTAGKAETKMGLSASHCIETAYDGLLVSEENLLGEIDRGFGVAMAGLDGGRIGIASQALGIARSALDSMLDAVRSEPRLLASQEVEWALAESATAIEASRLLVRQAAEMRDQGVGHSRASSMAKFHSSRTANEVVRMAMSEVFESAGLVGTRIERIFRDARIVELYEGTSEIQKMVIARNLLREETE
jgi:alkylation response protein AidB-like acyl-CoA dehydrogenase